MRPVAQLATRLSARVPKLDARRLVGASMALGFALSFAATADAYAGWGDWLCNFSAACMGARETKQALSPSEFVMALVGWAFEGKVNMFQGSVIQGLISIPDFTQGRVAEAQRHMTAIAYGGLGAVMTISVIRYWLSGVSLSGSGGIEAAEGFIRSVFAALLVLAWPWAFRTGIGLTNALTDAIVTPGIEKDLGTMIGALGLSTLVPLPIPPIVPILLAGLGLIAVMTVIVMKFVLTGVTAFLFVAGPLWIIAWPIQELNFITRTAGKAVLMCFVIPVSWGVIVVVFVAIGGRTTSLDWFKDAPLIEILMTPGVAFGLLITLAWVPLKLSSMVTMGASVPGAATAKVAGGMALLAVGRQASAAVSAHLPASLGGKVAGAAAAAPKGQGSPDLAADPWGANRTNKDATEAQQDAKDSPDIVAPHSTPTPTASPRQDPQFRADRHAARNRLKRDPASPEQVAGAYASLNRHEQEAVRDAARGSRGGGEFRDRMTLAAPRPDGTAATDRMRNAYLTMAAAPTSSVLNSGILEDHPITSTPQAGGGPSGPPGGGGGGPAAPPGGGPVPVAPTGGGGGPVSPPGGGGNGGRPRVAPPPIPEQFPADKPAKDAALARIKSFEDTGGTQPTFDEGRKAWELVQSHPGMSSAILDAHRATGGRLQTDLAALAAYAEQHGGPTLAGGLRTLGGTSIEDRNRIFAGAPSSAFPNP